MSKLFDLKVFAIALVASMLLSTLLVFNISSKAANTGSTQTTNVNCVAQNINHYAVGEEIWYRGADFTPNTSYNWQIIANDNRAECGHTKGAIIYQGTLSSDGSGNFCTPLHTVNSNDCGEFKATLVDFDKNDNFQAGAAATSSATPTPTPTPTATSCGEFCDSTPTPSPTPDPGTSTPTPTSPSCGPNEHLNLQGDKCLTFELGGPSTGGGSSNGGGQVLGASTVRGQVLGASTLGATGTANDIIAFSIIALEASVAVISGYEIKKTL